MQERCSCVLVPLLMELGVLANDQAIIMSRLNGAVALLSAALQQSHFQSVWPASGFVEPSARRAELHSAMAKKRAQCPLGTTGQRPMFRRSALTLPRRFGTFRHAFPQKNFSAWAEVKNLALTAIRFARKTTPPPVPN